MLTGAVQGAAEGRVAQVEFPCTSVSGEPADVRAFIVGGHGGDARLIGITRLGADRFRARSASVATGGGPNRAPSGPVEFLRQELPATVLVPAFDRMRTALAARITTTNRLPQTPTTLQPIGVSSASSSIELALRDTRGRVAVRSWQGYHGTVGAEDRVPIELAWQTLRETLSAIASAPASDPEPEDRALLAHAWRQRAVGYERSWYATRALLLFAARAGSPDLIPLLLPQLDADDPDLRRLAVDALAAITEHDARRDPSGNARPLEDVVAEYRRECSYPTQSR